jgi:hypothetical protein
MDEYDNFQDETQNGDDKYRCGIPFHRRLLSLAESAAREDFTGAYAIMS